jgi:hypothetical protein
VDGNLRTRQPIINFSNALFLIQVKKRVFSMYQRLVLYTS